MNDIGEFELSLGVLLGAWIMDHGNGYGYVA
jgi:hypothetical protein